MRLLEIHGCTPIPFTAVLRNQPSIALWRLQTDCIQNVPLLHVGRSVHHGHAGMRASKHVLLSQRCTASMAGSNVEQQQENKNTHKTKAQGRYTKNTNPRPEEGDGERLMRLRASEANSTRCRSGMRVPTSMDHVLGRGARTLTL
jgi:hypothetical protein